MKKFLCLLLALVMVLSLGVGTVAYADEGKAEVTEETHVKRNGPPSGSGNWGDYATYTWDAETATLTITQTDEQRLGHAVKGNDVAGYSDAAETLVFVNCNVTDFSGYSMKYLKFDGFADWQDFVNCTNLEEVEAKGTLSGGPFTGCNNLKKFTILGILALDWIGIPKTCVFYGPEMYQEYFEGNGFEYHVTDWNPCEHGQHDYQPCADCSNPTCTSAGLYHAICSRCGDEVTVENPALGHAYDKNTHECIRCGELDPNYGGSEDPANPFNDVKSGKWYYDAVLWAVGNGVTKGTSETTFSPNRTCTRAEIVTFLWRAAGSPEPASDNNPFDDVTGGYYYKAVLWAVENGITAGTSKTTFSPNDTCTRAQIVTFLWRYEGSKKEGDASKFKDLKEGAYYVDAVAWAVENGVTAGTTETTFSPDKICSRAEAVTFIYRVFGEK